LVISLEKRVLMVYKLYEPTWEEALIVVPELPGIISQEDYEKAGVEELKL
jgi:hypothetical protein